MHCKKDFAARGDSVPELYKAGQPRREQHEGRLSAGRRPVGFGRIVALRERSASLYRIC